MRLLAKVEAFEAERKVGTWVPDITRGGRLNDARFGVRMRGEGIYADQIHQVFRVACRKAGLAEDGPALSTTAFRKPQGRQLGLGL